MTFDTRSPMLMQISKKPFMVPLYFGGAISEILTWFVKPMLAPKSIRPSITVNRLKPAPLSPAPARNSTAPKSMEGLRPNLLVTGEASREAKNPDIDAEVVAEEESTGACNHAGEDDEQRDPRRFFVGGSVL
ncbi:hypothetical protein M5K25_007829 [Dendrobium thyrsiflorum]|uniref:Uncharacterized protein n=1 Tax=Dendrobium thyrsiflorum TaxID=117978 RepID=A0ABD0VM92_DENTH